MATPILATKLYVPSVRPKAVSRSRLIERLSRGLHRKFTLVSAPAGFGKTALVAEWVAERDRPVAWLSLGEEDGDARRFLSYLIAALQTVEPTLGESVLRALHSPQAPPTEVVLTNLLNDVAGVQEPFLFVLDDYHTIEAQEVDDAVTFLLEYLPPHMHLVIATREDPPLPLARLRARDQVTELRAADLRFTPDEAAAFFGTVTDLNLSADDITALEARTEGWIAGLQMAALSLRGRADAAGFVQAFTGSHRFVLDYLLEEVLQGQREHVRSFLLRTSILERLSGPLCDAVTGQGDGQGMLEALERANLFVVPLDDEREWYRYHHLFADVLQVRLKKERPDEVPALHRRASEWFEQNSLPSEAVHHAFAAEDYARAADLVEATCRAMDRTYQSATWLGWTKRLPDEIVRARPVLSAGYAWALLDAGEIEAAEPRLQNAERWLETLKDAPETTDEMVVVDETELRLLPARIASGRAYRARALGDVAGTAKYAQQALDLSPETEPFERGLAALLLGCASWAGGDLNAAEAMVSESASHMWTAGNIPFAISFTSYLAEIVVAQGRLLEAIRVYEDALQRTTAQEKAEPTETVVLHLGLSELHHERGDLKAAMQHLARSEELGEQVAFPAWHRHWSQAWARMKQAQGDRDGALERLEAGERLLYRHVVPEVCPVAALKARVWIAQGKLDEARAWARERGLSPHDELSYLLEFEHITLARLLIAQHKTDEIDGFIQAASGLLEHLLKAAEAGERAGSAIEILILRALAHEARGDISAALRVLERALTLAEPEGYVHIFVDEGPTMAELLSEAAARKMTPNYVARLLAAFQTGKPGGSEAPSSLSADLLEPLSERELEVLHLVAQGLSNREIGKRLFRALDTVKGHNRNIFGKLGVRNRTEAVIRARELGLLEP